MVNFGGEKENIEAKLISLASISKKPANSVVSEDTKIPDEDNHIEIGNENNDICIHNKEDSALETYIKSLDCQVRLLVKEFTTNKTTVDKTLQDHSKILIQLQNRETNTDLQDKAKSAEDEKVSLITAIKLLYKKNERNQEQSNVNQADQINSEEQQRQQHDPRCHQVNPNIQINNRFAGLSVEEHTEEVSMLQVNPTVVAERVDSLASEMEKTSETKVIISELVARRDMNDQVKTVNKQLRKHCQSNGWTRIQHNNISFADLNRGGLQLNHEGPKLASEIPVSSSHTSYTDYLINTDKRFQFMQTNNDQVFSVLSKLCESKATGLDQISARLVRECADLISSSITNIFNLSLILGTFPEDWKCAKVTPIFKQEHDLLSEHQSGFRSLHSTAMALLEATDSWAYNIDRGNTNAV
ncbi:Hypothetical predicted protein, partial [Paramuricea clavata]